VGRWRKIKALGGKGWIRISCNFLSTRGEDNSTGCERRSPVEQECGLPGFHSQIIEIHNYRRSRPLNYKGMTQNLETRQQDRQKEMESLWDDKGWTLGVNTDFVWMQHKRYETQWNFIIEFGVIFYFYFLYSNLVQIDIPRQLVGLYAYTLSLKGRGCVW